MAQRVQIQIKEGVTKVTKAVSERAPTIENIKEVNEKVKGMFGQTFKKVGFRFFINFVVQ